MGNFKAWAKDVALRAIKTAAQAAVALVTANTAGLTHLDFATVADVAAMAAFVCVLQNLSNLKVPDPAARDALAVEFFKSVDRSAPRVGSGVISGPSGPLAPKGPPILDPTQPVPSP